MILLSVREQGIAKATVVGGGDYGDVFWSLQPITSYIAGGEIHCHLYVANTTDVDRNYMILGRLTKNNQVVGEFPILVGPLTWFSVGAGEVSDFITSLVLGYSDCTLSVHLYEESTGDEVDSVSATLTTAGLLQLPGVPGGVDWSSMIMLMVMVLMIGMVMPKMLEEKEKKQ